MVTLFLISTLLPAGASDLLEMTDEKGDVIWRGFVSRQVDGYREIDIVSLTSSASLQDVTVELTMKDDVSDSLGYVYSVSAFGINIAYTEGDFQVWKWENEIIEIDNVQTGVNGEVITCVLPRTVISGELMLNATAQYYIPSGLVTSSENYYDGVGEFGEGTRAPSIGDLDRHYIDPSGDVEMSYYDERTVNKGAVDILFFSADLNDDIIFSISMEDDIAVDGTINYSFFGAGIEVIYSGGDTAFIIDDGILGETLDDVEISGPNLMVTVPGSEVKSSLGPAFAAVRMDEGDESYSIDMVPDDPYAYNDLLPFPSGEKELLSIHVQSPERVVMTREFTGFSSREAEDIRSMLDDDGDGSVTRLELDLFFKPSSDISLEDSHESDVRLDGRIGSLTMSLSTEGILGSSPSSGEVRITWKLAYTFDSPSRDTHHIELEGPSDPLRSYTFYPGTQGSTSLHLRIELNSSWRLDPLSLEPSIISNHMGPDAGTIDMEMDPEEYSRFEAGELYFEFYRRSEYDDDEVADDQEEGGFLWLYISILVGMLIVIVMIHIWSKSRETD